MSDEKLEIGDGITRRQKRTVVDPNDSGGAASVATAFEQLSACVLQEWGPQKAIVEAIRRDAARQRAEDIDRAAQDPKYIGSSEYQDRYRERSTVAWYVQEMDGNATMAELAMAGGRPWEAVSWAMKLAEALAEARLRLGWNRAAVVGQKQLDHSADGRARLRKQSAGSRVARVKQLVASGLTVRLAMDQTAQENGVSYSAISADYYPPKRSKPVD